MQYRISRKFSVAGTIIFAGYLCLTGGYSLVFAQNPAKNLPPKPTVPTKAAPTPTPKSASGNVSNDDDVLRVDTRLVTVPTLVFDGSGKPLANLKAANFVIYEDGKPQELANFGTAETPFEVALLLDTSGSTRGDLDLIRRAAENFINSLREGDKVSIVSFKNEIENGRRETKVELVSNLTSDRKELKAALATLNTGNGTPYYDGMLEIARRVFNQSPTKELRGRRAIVALTDGVDSTSDNDFAEVRETLQSKGITSYFVQVNTQDFFEDRLLGDCDDQETLRFSPAQMRRYYKSFVSSKKVERKTDFCELGEFERLAISKKLYEAARAEMKELADKSGGKTFPVEDLREANAAFRQVAAEIGTQYSIGYYSSNEKHDGTFRRIRIELKGVPAGMRIQSREGYTAPKD